MLRLKIYMSDTNKYMTLNEVPCWQCTVKPSEETAWSNVTYWNPRDYSDEAGGRWLLFYRRDDLDDAWARAKRLRRQRVARRRPDAVRHGQAPKT